MPTVRTAREDDLPDLLTLYRMLTPHDSALEPAEVREQWRGMLEDDELDVVVLDHDDRLVATALLSITPNLTRNARPFALIENVVTHEDYRGEGFGKRCVQATIDRADERGCYKVMLLTGTEEEWKHQFYEDCGFDRDEKAGFYVDLRED